MTEKDQPDLLPNEEQEEEKELGGQMTFLEHLAELRERLIRMLIAIVIAVAICLSFADTLFYILMLPVPNFVIDNTKRELKLELNVLNESLAEKIEERTEIAAELDGKSKEEVEQIQAQIDGLEEETQQTQTRIDEIKNQLLENMYMSINTTRVMVTSPVEYIIIWLKVAFVAGLFLAFPYLFYEIWMFVSPGLYKRERNLLIPIILSSWLCFIMGGLFCYFVIFKFTLEFLVNFAPGFLDQSWIVTNYINMFLRMLIAFGIVFEEPVVIYLLTKMGFVTSSSLRKVRPYAIVGMFAFSAMITPPDIISQIGCALPLIIFYEISIYIATFIEKKEEEEETVE